MVPDLESGDRLAEQKSERAEIGVSTTPQPELQVLLWGKFPVLHVAEMVLAVGLVKDPSLHQRFRGRTSLFLS